MIGFFIRNGRGKRYSAKVSKHGQIITAPLEYNETYYNSMSSISTAYNFIAPKNGKQFVIDGYIIESDKNVSATTGAEIPVIEAASPGSLTPTKTIFTLELGKLAGRNATRLNILTSAGIWINASTDDATVNLTLLGYYINT